MRQTLGGTDARVSRDVLRAEAHGILAEELAAVSVARLCARCGSSAHGAPSVRVRSGRVPSVSVSYAADLVAVAWCFTGPVGVDVELDGPSLDGQSRREWTRQEALFKAGTAVPTAALDLPGGFVGTVAGLGVSWRLAGPAARGG